MPDKFPIDNTVSVSDEDITQRRSVGVRVSRPGISPGSSFSSPWIIRRSTGGKATSWSSLLLA